MSASFINTNVDYDRDADVLYISFDHPQNATDSEMTDDGFLLRYRGEQLVGVTILSMHRLDHNGLRME
uniref:DUF2283 domain-containing protein n=1 Tax=Candidatus Kentrum sp. SD TaxID=2126332 RepID=A0A451BMY6_9GAMM|nr:MAG: Protein of unknown function (DUF2283) [Candidatus Kentron sp. SD]